MILEKLGEQPSMADLATFPEAVRVIRATSRLAKLDFWIRNPDYLADEILNDVDAGMIEMAIGLGHAARMLAGSAPMLHLYPMQRYKYGAWELPDNAFAVLKYLALADQKRVSEIGVARARRDYFLFANGQERIELLRKEVPQIDWYDKQADAIALLSVGATGAAAKARQYEQPDYATTPVGTTIGPILDRVRERFITMAAANTYPIPRAFDSTGSDKLDDA